MSSLLYKHKYFKASVSCAKYKTQVKPTLMLHTRTPPSHNNIGIDTYSTLKTFSLAELSQRFAANMALITINVELLNT